MNFTLSRKPHRRDDTLTTFHVLSDNGIVGSINVPHAEADDLERHWRGVATPPQASSAPTTKQGSALAAAMEATRRPGALPPDHAREKENPAVAAMLRAAPKNRLTKEAVLRGCC
jgi:hypothetical protein